MSGVEIRIDGFVNKLQHGVSKNGKPFIHLGFYARGVSSKKEDGTYQSSYVNFNSFIYNENCINHITRHNLAVDEFISVKCNEPSDVYKSENEDKEKKPYIRYTVSIFNSNQLIIPKKSPFAAGERGNKKVDGKDVLQPTVTSETMEDVEDDAPPF